MAFERSFTFPQSHVEETSRTSPFTVGYDDAQRLDTCEAFQIIRDLLIRQKGSKFCSHHLPSTEKNEEGWLLQRDITYALILPVIEIYSHASQLARFMLGNRNIFDLELVFRGEARGAFSWLQCFIVEEEDWCSGRGCPACVVSYVLQAEPTIRMVLIACRLSQSLRQHQGDPSPILDFWLASLRKALDEDPFWGPGFWKDVEARASNLEKGIQQLVRQCYELGTRLPNNTSYRSSKSRSPILSREVLNRSVDLLPFKPDRQNSIAIDISSWMHRIVLGCWTTILTDAAEANRKISVSKPQIQAERLRSYSS